MWEKWVEKVIVLGEHEAHMQIRWRFQEIGSLVTEKRPLSF